MAEASDLSATEDNLQWKPSSRHSRKSGSSNIFSGVNLHQLHRLFRTAGDRNAEHRAKLVWQEMETDVGRTEEEKEQEGEDEAGLAQALVGLRVRARNKTGIRTEGHGNHKWLRGPGCLRVEEPLAALSAEDDEANLRPDFELLASDDIQENPNPFKPAPWRLGVRLESTRDSERYLHRILH